MVHFSRGHLMNLRKTSSFFFLKLIFYFFGDKIEYNFFVCLCRKLRATDVAEGQVMKALYQIRSKEICPDDVVAAHRDNSILNGTLVTQIPDSAAEQQPWKLEKSSKKNHEICPWIDVKNSKVFN